MHVLRRDSRYAVRDGLQVKAKLTLQEAGDTRQTQGHALDLSSRGAKLQISEPLLEKQAVAVELAPQGSAETISVTGNTCWVRPVRENVWWLGISFDKAIDDELMERLAKDGLLDRRYDDRSAIDQTLVAKFELAEAACVVHLRDFSAGGLGIWLENRIEPGMRVLLAVDETALDAHPIVARVKWLQPEGDGHSAGCIFLDKEGYPELRRQLARKIAAEQDALRRRSRRYMVGLVAGVITLLLGINLLAQGFSFR